MKKILPLSWFHVDLALMNVVNIGKIWAGASHCTGRAWAPSHHWLLEERLMKCKVRKGVKIENSLLKCERTDHWEGSPVVGFIHVFWIKCTLVKFHLLLLFSFSQALKWKTFATSVRIGMC